MGRSNKCSRCRGNIRGHVGPHGKKCTHLNTPNLVTAVCSVSSLTTSTNNVNSNNFNSISNGLGHVATSTSYGTISSLPAASVAQSITGALFNNTVPGHLTTNQSNGAVYASNVTPSTSNVNTNNLVSTNN